MFRSRLKEFNMNEASKTRDICWNSEVKSLLVGKGIDIGCGPDPIMPDVRPFDLSDGDANFISQYVSEKYDYVFSSHCLEHMKNPVTALQEWYSILKPGGHLIVLVPDEDLYEQGVFPSAFNGDHKFTFTISKKKSWSEKSINVLDLLKQLPNSTLVNLELQDHGYDRSLIRHGYDSKAIMLWRRLSYLLKKIQNNYIRRLLVKVLSKLGAVIDQTALGDNRLAQIQFIVRKNKE